MQGTALFLQFPTRPAPPGWLSVDTRTGLLPRKAARLPIFAVLKSETHPLCCRIIFQFSTLETGPRERNQAFPLGMLMLSSQWTVSHLYPSPSKKKMKLVKGRLRYLKQKEAIRPLCLCGGQGSESETQGLSPLCNLLPFEYSWNL